MPGGLHGHIGPQLPVGPMATGTVEAPAIAWITGPLCTPVCQNVRVGRLLLVRHAQSVWNAAGRWQGWSDAPLSELGMDQARLAGQALSADGVMAGIVAASDLARAAVTAELIAFELEYEKRWSSTPICGSRILAIGTA